MKKYIISMAILAVVISIVSIDALSQSRPRPRTASKSNDPTPIATPKRPVIINTRNGNALRGNFFQADANSVEIEVEGVRQSIKTDEVTSIEFASDSKSSKGIADAREALKALRKIASGVEVGITYQQYSQLIIDTKATADQALAELPAGELKDGINLAMEAYADARRTWYVAINHRSSSLDVFSEFQRMQKILKETYKVPEEFMQFRSSFNTFSNQILSRVWKTASEHLSRAMSLLQQ